MPITYEYTPEITESLKLPQKLSPSPELGTFLLGLVIGYFVLPMILPIIGIKLYKWAWEK